MVAFFLALCTLGTWEVAADNDEWRWCRIYEGRAVTVNGGIAGSDGMTVELGGFWRKPTEVGERFEEVPRRLRYDSDVQVSWEERADNFWLVLEEEDHIVRRRLGG
jgi:hypothetical protein